MSWVAAVMTKASTRHTKTVAEESAKMMCNETNCDSPD